MLSEVLGSKIARTIVLAPNRGISGTGSVASAFSSVHLGRAIQTLPRDTDQLPQLPQKTGLAIATTRYVTGNGLSVVFWNKGSMPVLHSRLVVSSGRAMEPVGESGLAEYSGHFEVYDTSMVYRGYSTSTLLDGLLSTVFGKLRHPGAGMPDPSRERRKHLRSKLAIRDANESMQFQQRMREAVFGPAHPNGRPVLNHKGIGAMTRDHLLNWTRKHVVPGNSTLILTGQFDPQELKKWIAFYSDHLSRGGDSPTVSAPLRALPGPQWIAGRSSTIVPTLKVDIRFPGTLGVDASHGARLVLTRILNSKLARLREQDALSYGIHANYVPQQAGGYWRISGTMDPTRARAAGVGVQALLDEIRSGTENYRTAFFAARQKQVDTLLASTGPKAPVTCLLTNSSVETMLCMSSRVSTATLRTNKS